MRLCACLLLGSLLTFAAGCGKKDAAVSDQDRLQGVWKVEVFDTGREEKMNDKDKEELAKVRLAIKGDRLYFIEPEGYAKEETFVIDTTKDPKHITLTRLDDDGKPRKRRDWKDGKPVEGDIEITENIYKFDGDKLVLALSDGIDKAPRPTEFKSRPFPKFDPNKKNETDRYAILLLTMAKTTEPFPEIKKRPKFTPPVAVETKEAPAVPAPPIVAPEPPSKDAPKTDGPKIDAPTAPSDKDAPKK
jgi:uncharacterized protein (TIGR03067 family)